MSSTIHHDVSFSVPAQKVYDLLTKAANFAAFTSAPAEIDDKPGGTFSLFGGQIEGRNIELIEGQRVVQAWRAGNWDPGVYSVVHFELRPSDGGCELSFDHTGYPAGADADLDAGWTSNYWEPMKQHLSIT